MIYFWGHSENPTETCSQATLGRNTGKGLWSNSSSAYIQTHWKPGHAGNHDDWNYYCHSNKKTQHVLSCLLCGRPWAKSFTPVILLCCFFYFPEFKPEKLRLSKVWKPVTERTDLDSQLWIQTQLVQIPSSSPSSWQDPIFWHLQRFGLVSINICTVVENIWQPIIKQNLSCWSCCCYCCCKYRLLTH